MFAEIYHQISAPRTDIEVSTFPFSQC